MNIDELLRRADAWLSEFHNKGGVTVPDDSYLALIRDLAAKVRRIERLQALVAPHEPVEWPKGLRERIRAASERFVNGQAPRRIPADPTDADLVLAEIGYLLDGNDPPFWVAGLPKEPLRLPAAPAPEWQPVPPRARIKPTHEAADAFWKYWRENGETHKHGYYESTWGAINAALACGWTAPAAPAPCIGNDPACPCQDGDLCHYKDSLDGKTKAMKPAATAPEPLIVAKECAERGCCAHDPRIDGAGVLFHPAAGDAVDHRSNGMSDLTKRLREMAGGNDSHYCNEAADEIERLTRSLSAWEQVWEGIRDNHEPNLNPTNKPLAVAATFQLAISRAERAEAALRDAQAEIGRRHGIGGELVVARRERDEALALLREAQKYVPKHDGLFHNDLIGERSRCATCQLLARIDALIGEKP